MSGDADSADFRSLVLLLRGRAGVTQREVAAAVGVSDRAVQAWESGDSYPSAQRLQRLIAFYLSRGGFSAGRETDEATAVWATVRREAGHFKAAFDHRWFHSLLESRATSAGTDASAVPILPADAVLARQDWEQAPAVRALYGRDAERDLFRRWLVEDRCRVVALFGMGGVGKTTLAAQLARDLATDFELIHWRSLRNAPPFHDWLAGAILFLSAQEITPAADEQGRLQQLLLLLREHRCLLVLDNIETVIEPGASGARYREGYGGYGTLLQTLAETAHQSSLLITSREQPAAFSPLDGGQGPVRSLRLRGLDVEAGRALLQDKGLSGNRAAWTALVGRYGGNALALRMVGETIGVVFGGDIAAFVSEGQAVFGDIRRLLDGQLARLSPAERLVVHWLAVEREPVRFGDLVSAMEAWNNRGAVMEAVENLSRRSLLERTEHTAAFTLQPAVLEFVTEDLIATVAGEIGRGEVALLTRLPLLKATAKDYVRGMQERLLIAPLLARLTASAGVAAAEQRLVDALDRLRRLPAAEQGYAPGNLVNLLRLLRGDLRSVNLSGLSIRQAYLQDVEMQDARLAGAQLSEAVIGEVFTNPTCVTISADGAILASGTVRGEIYLWRQVDRTLLAVLPGHSESVWGVALTGDGRLLVSGGGDGAVRVWEVASGRLLATLRGHERAVWSVAITDDGRLLASGGENGTVRCWETETGRALTTLAGHEGTVRGVALSGDGQMLASGSLDGTVRLWDTERGALVHTLEGHSAAVYGVALLDGGDLLASASHDGTIRLWDPATGQAVGSLRGHRGLVYNVALSADGLLLASSGSDGTVRLWDTERQQTTATFQGHTGAVLSVAMTRDGQIAVSGGLDGTVRLWETESRQLLAALEGHTGLVYGAGISGDGRLIASGSGDGRVRLWDAASGRLRATLDGHTGAVWSIGVSRDGRVVASASHDGTVRLWEAERARLLARFHGHTGAALSVATSSDGRLVISGGSDGTVRLWDTEKEQALAVLEGHAGAVLAVAISPSGRLLASGSSDGMVHLWETAGGRLLHRVKGHSGLVYDVAFSEDERLIASGSSDGNLCLVATDNGEPLATFKGQGGAVRGVALSPDGVLVICGDSAGMVRVWNVAEGRVVAALAGHSGAIRSVAISEDGRALVSGSVDGTLRLWHTDDGSCTRVLRNDRRYERLDISGLRGVTAAQRGVLLALGAVEADVDAPSCAGVG